MEVQKRGQLSLSALSSSLNNNNVYSSENLAEIAIRVVNELNLYPFDDDFYSSLPLNDAFHNEDEKSDSVPEATGQNDAVEENNDEDDDDEESEFEFAVLCGEESSSTISADEIFDNGQIRPMFPIFNSDLIYAYKNDTVSKDPDPDPDPRTIRLPLKKLLTNYEIDKANFSPEAADNLESIPPPGTYCVWSPKKKGQEEEAMMRRKSTSTGSSKPWKLRDLLFRSNSDGKDTFVFLTPSNHHHNHHYNHRNGGDSKRREKVPAVGVKRRGGGLGDKKKTFLPYRQDLIGFFAAGPIRPVRLRN